MSGTSNVQNLVANVFRPVYTFDPATQAFTAKVELTNVDTISANTISVFTASVGDAFGNVYVGSNAGNTTQRLCCNVTALGASAGRSVYNSINSVFIGYNAGANANGSSNTIAIGANTAGNGSNNVFIGCKSGMTNVAGSNNILLGPNLLYSALCNNQFIVGTNTTTPLLIGDMSSRVLGVAKTPASTYALDVGGTVHIDNGYRFLLGIDAANYVADINGSLRVSDGYGQLTLSNDGTNSILAYNSVGPTAKTTFTMRGITQPIIQTGQAILLANATFVTVTLPVAYSGSTFVMHASLRYDGSYTNTVTASFSVRNVTTQTFSIYTSSAVAFPLYLNWSTYGT